MKIKKGFTLVELVAVIAIIALISVLVIAAIVDTAGDFKESGQSYLNEMVINAAKQYVRSTPSVKSSINSTGIHITYQKLLDKGYLSSNVSSYLDVTTNQPIDLSDHYVCVKLSSGEYVYKIDTCN